MIDLAAILAEAAALAPPPIVGVGAVDHVGVLCRDLDRLGPELARLGLYRGPAAAHPEVGLRVAFADRGPFLIELLSVTSPTSPLAGAPEGLNHIAYRVPDLRALLAALDDRFTIVEPVRRGSRGHDIAIVRLRGAPGPAFELVDQEGAA
jgi:hypothetical protein